jgi:hypothetical protein
MNTASLRSCRKGQNLLMRNSLFIVALVMAPLGVASPALAQIENERVLTIFGDDKCPKNTICVVAKESERYRIPKQFRSDGIIKPENQSWAARAEGTLSAGAKTGIGSCSANGPGGWTGCWSQQMRAARAEAKANAKDNNPDIER